MAHIPDGFLSAPVLATTTVASAGALALAAHRSRQQLRDRQAPLLGAATAFVFAAQMFNFPLGAGTSAHLLGGVLVAAVAGPWVGMLVLFSVILVQALLFQDGGVTAIGANTLNMAVVGAGVGYLLYRWLRLLLGEGLRRRVLAASLAAYVSAALVGTSVAVELALSGTVPLRPALLAVGGSHLLVGLGEALLTGGILGMAARLRPELIEGAPVTRRARRWAFGGLGVALVVAVGAAYGASTRPDALASAAGSLGLAAHSGTWRPLAQYSGAGPWGALLGVGVVFVLAWALFRVSAGRRPA
ncbi:MAG TPA: energy-coupling factor ABC transporter permease [Longimicrobiales bacterium]|nr:energy-coupling factor ABC transporter permease [Longimicrobiales bacterium]